MALFSPQTTLDVRQALGRIDTAREIAALAQIDSERAEIESARKAAVERIEALTKALRERPDDAAEALAHALRAGDAQTQPRDELALRDELAKYQAAIRSLDTSRTPLDGRAAEVRSEIRNRISQALKPAIDELQSKAASALSLLENIQTAARAFHLATDSPDAGALAQPLKYLLSALGARQSGAWALRPPSAGGELADVSPDAVELIEAAATVAPEAGIQSVRAVARP